MTSATHAPRTRVLLSFSSAYAGHAKRLSDELAAANVDVRLDQWEGGGGVRGVPCVQNNVDDVAFVIPLLTPSDAAPTWVGIEWKEAIFDSALARGVDVLPARGAGDLEAVPPFLRQFSFADLRDDDYINELRRLVATIGDRTGDTAIVPPEGAEDVTGAPSLAESAVHPITLELGKALGRLLQGDDGAEPFIDDLLPMMYDGLFYELGVQFPWLHIHIDDGRPAWSARVLINDIPETEFDVPPLRVMVNERVEVLRECAYDAEPAENPASGASCATIPAEQARAAKDCGMVTWNEREFLVLALSAVLRHKAADFISVEETEAMLAQVEPAFPVLVAETVPRTVPLVVLTDVLKRLVAELVSIRNIRRILMTLADAGRAESDPLMLTEHVRSALRRQINHQYSRGTHQLFILLLEPSLESLISQSIRHTATGSYVDLESATLRRIIEAVREPFCDFPDDAQKPQILTVSEIRSSVRRLVATSMPWLHVLSYDQLRPDANIQRIGTVSLDGFRPSRGVAVVGRSVRPRATSAPFATGIWTR